MQSIIRDYSLIGKESKLTIENGLADAVWYKTPVDRDKFNKLLVRRDGPAIRDTLIWFSLIIGFGLLFFYTRHHWWAMFPLLAYSLLYASVCDSRWHESCHGTAFKTDWMNKALYEIASFMVVRQSVPWRWSHVRHHSDTIIRGRDPEIASPRPPVIFRVISMFFNIRPAYLEMKKIIAHAMGKIDPQLATYIPKTEYGKVFLRARIYLAIYLAVIVSAILFRSILPLMYIGVSMLAGSWLMPIYGLTQHAGLAENVLDHRLNCRTVYMNRINRYLYWNMNYHLEHHMFPLVPYHALPQLHELIKHDCPKPYNGLIDAWKEIIPALFKQIKNPEYFVERKLPETAGKPDELRLTHSIVGKSENLKDGWIEVCPNGRLQKSDVIRFDFEDLTFAIYRTDENKFYATDGFCTHGNAHLAEGFVSGKIIECPKHNGRFDITDGTVQRQPACIKIGTYEVKVQDETIYLNLKKSNNESSDTNFPLKEFKVVSNENIATFIKELVLEPIDNEKLRYKPGEYIHLEIPSHDINFEYMHVNEPFKSIWKDELVFGNFAKNSTKTFRNYSMATNPDTDTQLKFNVRLALPPAGISCSAGVGSSYVFNLKKGDIVRLKGPFGDFHIKDTDREMVYIGGGAGMAPLRSHLSHLLETIETKRKVSYWYGARSLKELYYHDYFHLLSEQNSNFSFHVALSNPLVNEVWQSHIGYIHAVFQKEYLSKNDPLSSDYYLCGPPTMIEATLAMLKQYRVPENQIAYDEF